MRTKLALSLLVAALINASLAAAADPAGARRAPRLHAAAAILVDARDGHVLYGRNPDDRDSIASTTKLMTALLSVERLSLERRLRAASYHAAAAESQIELAPGERMSVADLLRALMLESANDAAATLARGAGGSLPRFVDLMNRRAQELGLRDTHYANPVGLDERGNYSSARDLSVIARAVLRDDFLAETVDMPRARLLTGSRPRIVVNRNDLVARVPWIDGVKTGHTAGAGYVLVGAGARKGAKLVSVVLGTPSEGARDADTLALLDYGFGLYRRVPVLRRGAPVREASVAYYGDRKVAIEPVRSVTLAVRHGQRVTTAIDAPRRLHGPLAEGERVGRASVFVDGRRIRSVTLVTSDAVPKAGFVRKLGSRLVAPLVLIAIVVAAFIALRRRQLRRAAADAARRRRRRQQTKGRAA